MQEMTDDIEIFAFLEKAGLADFDPAISFAREFRLESDFLLLLFSHSGKHKGCRLFICKETALEREAESVLLPALLALPEDSGYDKIKNAALSIAEQIIAERNSNRLFFDAH